MTDILISIKNTLNSKTGVRFRASSVTDDSTSEALQEYMKRLYRNHDMVLNVVSDEV
jgi:hypothetical protein